MAEQYTITAAELSDIRINLRNITNQLNVLDSNVDTVNENIKVIYSDLDKLTEEFHAFVKDELRRWELENATTNLGNVRQELQMNFGHYEEVRRSATGILQATDLGIVRKESISSAAENFTITCPGYWLAPALVALAAWIDDNEEVAAKSIAAAVERDDEKTSLMFALVARRAQRFQTALNWVIRYLDNQDPENLGREAIVIIDAYSAGLFAQSTEGEVEAKLDSWLAYLSSQTGFIEQQIDNWKVALNARRVPLNPQQYPYLRQYSPTWPVLQDVMEGANLNQAVLSYFTGIFETPNSTAAIVKQLDGVLSSLVTDFDDEELPLRRKERYYQSVIEFDGDTDRAKAREAAEKTALEEKRSFTQVLTDAAMTPDLAGASVSSQKFAIAYSREWVRDAHNDLTLSNRAKVPPAIGITIDTFQCQTANAQDQQNLEMQFDAHINAEKQAAHEQNKLGFAAQYGLYVGIPLIVVGALMLILGPFGVFLFLVMLGIGIYFTYQGVTGKKRHAQRAQQIEADYEAKRESGKQILRATCAEIVDFRREFAQRDAESAQVAQFLEALSPSEFIQSTAETPRKVASR